MGFDRIPEPLRSEVLAAQEVRQDVVLYWDELMRSDPEQLQARVEQVGAAIDVPVLAVFGQQLSSNERDYLRRLVRGAQLEEWPGRGHFVHLAEADRFAARLRAFVTSARGADAVRRPRLSPSHGVVRGLVDQDQRAVDGAPAGDPTGGDRDRFRPLPLPPPARRWRPPARQRTRRVPSSLNPTSTWLHLVASRLSSPLRWPARPAHSEPGEGASNEHPGRLLLHGVSAVTSG